MAVIYAAALRTTRMDAVLTAIGNAGKINIYAADDTLLATFDLPTPSGTVSGDILTFDCDPDLTDTALATKTATKATICTSADAVIVSGLTVGTGSENVVVNTTSFVTGATVTLQTATLTHNTAG